MKISIKKHILERHLQTVIKAIDPNPPLITLKGVLIEATKTYITLIATDGNLSIKETIETNKEVIVEETGIILVPCKVLLDSIKKQISEDILIEITNGLLFVNSKKSSITINLMEPKDFPNINFDLEGTKIKIKGEDFKQLYSDVGFAASENDRKIILNGINFSIKDRILIATATNSYRLATKKIFIDTQKEINITIFAKNLRNFVLANTNEDYQLNIDDQKIDLRYGSTLIQSKLIDGEYPKVDSFIPTSFAYKMKVNVKDMISAIDRATVISESSSSSVRMEIIPNKQIIIESKKEQIGSAKVELTDFQWEGEALQITFDSKFFTDALKTFKDDIEILFNGELKPIIIKSEKKPELVQLVLPQKTY